MGTWKKLAYFTDITLANISNIQVVRKVIDETVNNSAVLQNDDALFFASEANETWAAIIFLRITQGASATPNFKLAITAPSGAVIRYGGTWEIAGATSATDQSTGISGTALSVATDSSEVKSVTIYLTVRPGATSGNIQLQWAQNTATAVDTMVRAESWIIAVKIS